MSAKQARNRPSRSATPADGAARSGRGIGIWLPWIAMVVVVVVALAVGTVGGSTPTDAERAQNLAATIRCPACSSQSVSQSETPSSKGVKVVIADRIAAGNSDEEIRDFVASRYGRDVLLDPSGEGFGALVWALPVGVAVVAVGALVIRFRDWRPAGVSVTDDDRRLVDEALVGASSQRAEAAGHDPAVDPGAEASSGDR